jgi:tRNA U34 5-methylaminomethyl-2-thiouridine-forming methyltransferase MnmC
VQSNSAYRLVQLANGRFSIKSLAYGETFHPVVGPEAEAEALYLRQLELPERLRRHHGEFVIWDVGLGAAGNALAVLKASRTVLCPLRLVSFDQTLAPLAFARDHADHLPYLQGFTELVTARLEHPGVTLDFVHEDRSILWDVHLGNFPAIISASGARTFPKPHAILFDAHSPATNPEMWTQPLFTAMYRLLDPARPCAMPTYSRSTMLRVTLLLAGFYVGRGQATGEKEETTIASNRRELVREPLDDRWLHRTRKSTSAEPLWEPIYRQAPLSLKSWDLLQGHPQFS